jgi:hypothetical protein
MGFVVKTIDVLGDKAAYVPQFLQSCDRVMRWVAFGDADLR